MQTLAYIAIAILVIYWLQKRFNIFGRLFVATNERPEKSKQNPKVVSAAVAKCVRHEVERGPLGLDIDRARLEALEMYIRSGIESHFAIFGKYPDLTSDSNIVVGSLLAASIPVMYWDDEFRLQISDELITIDYDDGGTPIIVWQAADATPKRTSSNALVVSPQQPKAADTRPGQIVDRYV